MAECKQTNFRLNQESAELFRKFCKENGYDQAEGFDHLLKALEFSNAKSCIEGRMVEIQTFEGYLKKIMDAYLNSLEIAENTRERVLEEYHTNIKLRDKTIRDNEETISKQSSEIEILKAQKRQADSFVMEATEKIESANKRANAAQQLAAEKGKVNEMLEIELSETKSKIESYDSVKEALVNAQNEISMLKRDMELTIERAVRNAEKDMQKQMNELRDERSVLRGQVEALQLLLQK